jgi:hypothetical protein
MSEAAELGSGGGLEGQGTEQSREHTDAGVADQALDRGLALAARAAALGIELRALGSDAWLLRHARGGDIGAVRGHGPLLAAIAAFEAPSRDVLSLIAQRVRRAA